MATTTTGTDTTTTGPSTSTTSDPLTSIISITTPGTTTSTTSTTTTSSTTSSTTSTTPTATLPSFTQPVVTVFSTVPPRTTSTPSATAEASGGVGFFQNKGAVAAVFSILGLITLAILIGVATNAVRRRRARKFDRDVAEAAAEAARAQVNLDEDDDYGPGGYGAGGMHGYSDGSHGAYGQPPMALHSPPMSEMSGGHGMQQMMYNQPPAGGMSTGYDQYAAGAAGIGAVMSRARSQRAARHQDPHFGATQGYGRTPASDYDSPVSPFDNSSSSNAASSIALARNKSLGADSHYSAAQSGESYYNGQAPIPGPYHQPPGQYGGYGQVPPNTAMANGNARHVASPPPVVGGATDPYGGYVEGDTAPSGSAPAYTPGSNPPLVNPYDKSGSASAPAPAPGPTTQPLSPHDTHSPGSPTSADARDIYRIHQETPDGRPRFLQRDPVGSFRDEEDYTYSTGRVLKVANE